MTGDKTLVICNNIKRCNDKQCVHRTFHEHDKICRINCVWYKGFIETRAPKKVNCIIPRKYTPDMLKVGMTVQLKSLSTIHRHCIKHHGVNYRLSIYAHLVEEMLPHCSNAIEIHAIGDDGFSQLIDGYSYAWPLWTIKHIVSL